jgi:hypothetical protein
MEAFLFSLFWEWFCLLLTSIELVYRAGLEESLLSSIEWMTLRTGFYTDFSILDTTHGFESVSTRADYFDRFKIWMNIFSHKKKGVRD